MRWARFGIWGFLIFASVAVGAFVVQDDSSHRSLEYVRNLQPDCTLTDGYQCLVVEEDDFLQPDSWHRLIPAAYMQAWRVCYEDFSRIEDLLDEQKELKHYKVGFTENESQFIILLQGLLLPYIDEQSKPNGITGSVFGRSTKYWVNKKSLHIENRLFYK